MATVSGTLKLNDKMTPALKSVVTAIYTTISAMESMNVAASSSFQSARRSADVASAAVNDFANSFNNIAPNVRRAEVSLNELMSTALSLVAIIYGLRKTLQSVGTVGNISDKMQQSVARIDLINDGMRTTQEYQDMIFASANRARSSYLETANTVASLGTNAKDAFANTDEMIAFSELMNKSFKVSGADAQAQAGAMRQLSQALSSGVLRGDEFNSIAEQAPTVYNAIAKYMGLSKGAVRELAAEGAVTADIVKNAMFAAAEDIEKQFSMIPPTFADCTEQMKNNALRAFRPVLEQISEITRSERFARLMQDMSGAFSAIATQAMQFINIMAQIAAFVQDHTDTVLIGFAAIVSALVILKAQAMITAISTAAAWLTAVWPVLLIVAALAAMVDAYRNTEGALQVFIGLIGMVLLGISAWAAKQWILNTAMAANPIGAIIMAIAVLIGAIIAIIAWIVDLWKTNMDFKYGVLAIWDAIVFFFKGIPTFFQKVGNGIADAFAWAKVTVLTILQDMANGAINIINDLIAILNNIPGVAIEPINQLTFAATVAAEEEANKQARDQSLAGNEAALEMEKHLRKIRRASDRAFDQAAINVKAMQLEKSEAEQQAEYEFDYSQYGSGGELGDIGKVGSVGRINDDVTISDEDIKMLKDIASMEYQLQYTQLTPQLNATFGDIRETADAGAILSFVETSLEEALSSSLLVGVGG